MMQIFINPYHTLNTVSTDVDLEQGIQGYSDIERFEKDMINLMVASKGIGLAANQLGITKRFFCIGYESFDVFKKPVILWNPLIVRSSEETVEDVEGCLSFPKKGVNTKRYKIVEIETDNYKSNLTFGAGDTDLDLLESVCVQHEIDHLNGITIHDREIKLEPTKVEKKIGRNQKVLIACGPDSKVVKYKKAIPLLENGWTLVESE